MPVPCLALTSADSTWNSDSCSSSPGRSSGAVGSSAGLTVERHGRARHVDEDELRTVPERRDLQPVATILRGQERDPAPEVRAGVEGVAHATSIRVGRLAVGEGDHLDVDLAVTRAWTPGMLPPLLAVMTRLVAIRQG